MPQRFPQGTNLDRRRNLFGKARIAEVLSDALQDAAIGVSDTVRVPASTPAARAKIEDLERREMLSTSYFVATTGSDNNVGSVSAPFRTIQRAANVAQPGDFVEIETGTYHETVTPLHAGTSWAPITFQAYHGENVTVSGADPVSGWSIYNNTVSQAHMSWSLGSGDDQVFVDGVAINHASFPNAGGDYSRPGTEGIQRISVSGNYATIYDSHLTQSANYWKGSTIHLAPGQAWVDETGIVTSSSPGSVTFNFANGGRYATPAAGEPFYLQGKFQQLDTAGTWYRDPGTGQLYVWTPTGDSAAHHDVEAKARIAAFNLDNTHDITIDGVNIFAADVQTSQNSRDVVINGITATYLGSTTSLPNGWWTAPSTDETIQLRGANDVLENSTIAYAPQDGVFIDGSGGVVTNNVIHDVNSLGGDLAGVRVYGQNITVSHNTVYNAGRDGILALDPRVQVLYNTVHDAGLQTTEAGGIYTVGTYGNGASIAYNQVYNMHAGGYGNTALFLDNGASDWVVHNNITWNVDYSLKMNFTSSNNQIYNNTLGATIYSIFTNLKGTWNGTRIYNNALLRPSFYTRGATVTGNASSATGTVGAGSFTSGASGVVNVKPPVVTPPVVTPPVVTPPVVTPPVVTPPVVTPPVVTPPVVTPPVVTPPVTTPPVTLATTLVKAVNYTGHYAVKGDNFGGIGYANNNDWVSYKLDFGKGVSTFTAALASVHQAGTLEIRVGSPTGALAGVINVAYTGAWNHYTLQSTAVTGLAGVQTVYLVFKGTQIGVCNIKTLQFSTAKTPPAVTLATSLVKAVDYTGHYAVEGDNFGGIGYANNNDWVSYTLDFGTGATRFTAALASIHQGGTLEVRIGSPTGALAGTINVAYTGAWNRYTAQSTTVKGLTGVQTVYLVFNGTHIGICNISTLQFS